MEKKLVLRPLGMAKYIVHTANFPAIKQRLIFYAIDIAILM